MAYDTPYDSDGESSSEVHHERHVQGEGAQHKGPGGLMGHMYNRKLEQAQQVLAFITVTPVIVSLCDTNDQVFWHK